MRPSCLKDFLSRPDLLLERAEFCRFQGLLRTLWVWRLMNYLSCFSADRGKRGSRGSRVSRRWRFPGRSGGVLLEGGGSLSRLSFPFLSEAGGRPFRVANFHARGARHSPQESATADEPSGACPLVPLQRLGRNRLCRGGSPLLALGLGLWVPLHKAATAAVGAVHHKRHGLGVQLRHHLEPPPTVT